MFCSQAEARRMALGYLRAVTVVLKSKTNVGSHVEEEQVKTAWFHSRKEATDGVRGEREQYRDRVLRQAVDKIQNQQAPDSKDVRGGINPTVITKTNTHCQISKEISKWQRHTSYRNIIKVAELKLVI